MRKPRNVALLIDTSRQTGRGILQGVIRYNREHGPWSTYFQPHGIEEMPPSWLTGWQGDGILARINSRRVASLLRRSGLPVIDVRSATIVPDFPRFEVDNRAMAEMVVDHLLSCGIRRFAFCSYRRGYHRLYDERCDMFVDRVHSAGLPCSVFHPRSSTSRELPWETVMQQLEDWIGTLTGHVGIMACTDDLGLMVLDACRRVRRSVPDEIAVLGVENDPFICNLCTPPLTSVDVNPERIGFDACVLLEQMMRGKTVPRCIRTPPAGIVMRQSTDILAINDPAIVQALRYIRTHACMGMAVSQLTKVVPLSRSSLNRRFQELLGRTPKEEMMRVQLERAEELLINTDISVHDVARSCGFNDSNYFSRWFHTLQGTSPRRFRLKNRK